MPALDRIQQTAPDAVTLLRLLCFCDPEAIPISIFKYEPDALHQGDRYELPRAQPINKPQGIQGLRKSGKRVSSALPRESGRPTVKVQDD